MLVELRRDGGPLWIIPPGWSDPASPMRSASLPVLGGMLAVAPDGSRTGLPLAMVTDLAAASWWIEDVYGDQVLDAVTDDNPPSSAVAGPGPASAPVISVIQAMWLRRWWHPQSPHTPDIGLLDAEIGLLQVEAAVCFETDALAESRLSAGLAAILRLPRRIADETGPRRTFLDGRLAALVGAASRFADQEQPLYPTLQDLEQELDEHDRLSDHFLGQLAQNFEPLPAPSRPPASHAGGQAVVPEQHLSTTVDWLQVPARSTSGTEANVFAWVVDDEIGIAVEGGLEPVRQLTALAYASGETFPTRILSLTHDGRDYRGTDEWEPDAELSAVHILRAPLLDERGYTPRPFETALEDRRYVHSVLASRGAEFSATSLVSEVLN